MTGKTYLDPSLTLRAARWTDLNAVAELTRGTTTIGLGVDSANLTGATRLYQRAGIVVAGEFALYEKELRARES